MGEAEAVEAEVVEEVVAPWEDRKEFMLSIDASRPPGNLNSASDDPRLRSGGFID